MANNQPTPEQQAEIERLKSKGYREYAQVLEEDFTEELPPEEARTKAKTKAKFEGWFK
jgi:hypothetical protein